MRTANGPSRLKSAAPGDFEGVHQIEVDEASNLYVIAVANDRSQMFRPKT